jgi:glycine hydroxymethyltransferase
MTITSNPTALPTDPSSEPGSDPDPQLSSLLRSEHERQATTINLIASENYASATVRNALSSVLSAKYAEGYPGRRYYQGNAVMDDLERLAASRACELFDVDHANLQAHSGAEANHAVYLGLCKPGDTVLSITLSSGGHLSHGAPVAFGARYYSVVQADVDPHTEILDLDTLADLAERHRPRLIWIGTSSYSRWYDYERLRQIADSVGAYLAADIAHVAGLVAAGVAPTPVGHAHVITSTTHKTLRGPRGAMILTQDPDLAKQIDRAVFPGLQGGPHMHVIAGIAAALREASTSQFHAYARQVLENAQALARTLTEDGLALVSGGTDNHLMTIKLTDPVRYPQGRAAAETLETAGIVTNRNSIPYDPHPPLNPGGLRLGTAAMTTCGMGTEQLTALGHTITQVLTQDLTPAELQEIRDEMHHLRQGYPLPT